LTLEELLAREILDYNPNLVPRMRRRYGSLVTQAILEQSSSLALDAYEQTQMLPQTETEVALFVDGYTVNGNFNAGNDAFIILHKIFDNYLLKAMTEKENGRAAALLKSIEKEKNLLQQLNKPFIMPNLTHFELQHIRHKYFMIMPQYHNSIEIQMTMTPIAGAELYHQMALALNFLHNLPERYNHMDIKPSNICTREGGRLVLIDLGSVVPFGLKSESTRVYVPQDFQQRPPENPTSNVYVAEASNDWWMLAMTIAEKVYGLPVGLGATPPPLKSKLLEILDNEIWVKLVAKLVEG
jgi:serine/threonine protein kinase